MVHIRQLWIAQDVEEEEGSESDEDDDDLQTKAEKAVSYLTECICLLVLHVNFPGKSLTYCRMFLMKILS